MRKTLESFDFECSTHHFFHKKNFFHKLKRTKNKFTEKHETQAPQLVFFHPISTIPFLQAIEMDELSHFKEILKNLQKDLQKSIDEILKMYTTKEGITLLHYAAFYASSNIVKFLLENGMDKEALTSKGENALTYAERTGNKAVINLLKNHVSPTILLPTFKS